LFENVFRKVVYALEAREGGFRYFVIVNENVVDALEEIDDIINAKYPAGEADRYGDSEQECSNGDEKENCEV